MVNFDVTGFFQCLMEDTELATIVGEYCDEPAIAEEFYETPNVNFIILCDQDLKHTYCPGTDKILSGRLDFSLKFIGTKDTPRSTLRDHTNILVSVLKKFNGNCVSGIKIVGRSNNLIDSESERPYVAINAQAYFR